MSLSYALFPILTFAVIYIPTIKPNKPIADPKISTIKILTNNDELAASEIAAPDPTIPTDIPQKRFTNPTVTPAQKITNPENQFWFLMKGVISANSGSYDSTSPENTMAVMRP